MIDRFNVYQFFEDDSYEKVREAVPAQESIEAAEHYTNSVGVQLGLVKRVIVTDMGDSIVFEWTAKAGVVWPPHLAHGGETKH